MRNEFIAEGAVIGVFALVVFLPASLSGWKKLRGHLKYIKEQTQKISQ